MREEGAEVVGVHQIVVVADAVEAGVDVEEGEGFKLCLLPRLAVLAPGLRWRLLAFSTLVPISEGVKKVMDRTSMVV